MPLPETSRTWLDDAAADLAALRAQPSPAERARQHAEHLAALYPDGMPEGIARIAVEIERRAAPGGVH